MIHAAATMAIASRIPTASSEICSGCHFGTSAAGLSNGSPGERGSAGFSTISAWVRTAPAPDGLELTPPTLREAAPACLSHASVIVCSAPALQRNCYAGHRKTGPALDKNGQPVRIQTGQRASDAGVAAPVVVDGVLQQLTGVIELELFLDAGAVGLDCIHVQM